MKKALITGITGQDGSYLAEFLIKKGYQIHGIIRRASTFNTERIDHIYKDPHIKKNNQLFLHYGDLTDASNLNQLLKKIRPDEVYHLGAQSHVKTSFEIPEYTANVDALGTLRILDAIRDSGVETKFYQASSSEMFGNAPECPQNENTPFCPASPYAASKVFSYWIARIYREGYGIFACNGIMFNHESPRRGETFVTRKITRGIAKIIAGQMDYLYLGNLDAKRDWGYAPEYVEAMYLMLQQKKPDDYVIATGETHSVKEFLKEAFSLIDLNWRDFVKIDPRYFRPVEVNVLCGNSAKAKRMLGWRVKTTFKELVKIMLEADLKDVLGEDWQEKTAQFSKKKAK